MNDSKVRIFISSPSDLEHERALIGEIVESLTQEYLPYFTIEPVLWEQEALTAAQSFQAGLVRPAECEIVLVMLWTRLGTPLADDPYRGMTGTEWEFVDAVEASARPGGPEVLVYRKTSPRLVDINNAEATALAVSDRDRLETFFRRHFFNEDGSFRRAFREFDSDSGFRDLVETQLRKLLNRRIGAERRFSAGSSDWHGSPFRAGRPFDVADARVFTGRESEIRELISRLDALRESAPGLLLVSGASGSGKSSLVRAGLVPHLVRPYLFAGLAGCRWCLVDLGGVGDSSNPIAALAEALLAPATLGGALEALGLSAARLAGLMSSQPRLAAEQIRAALVQAERDLHKAGSGSEGAVHLAVILDPLDPLLEAGTAASEPVQRFSELLSALTHQPGVWVIATLRSDRLADLPRLPLLAALLDRRRWYSLESPAPARIRQVMEIPARVAGIDYEERSAGAGIGVVEALESDAAATRHWPPLLQQTLDELYEQALAADASDAGNRSPVLGVRDYRRIGGLTGSMLRLAATRWAALDQAARDALPRLCRALIELDGESRSRAAPRDGDLRVLLRDPDCAALLDALVDARLVVVESALDEHRESHCELPNLSLGAYFHGVLAQTAEEWRARLGLEFKRAAFGTDEAADSKPGSAPGASSATAEEGDAVDWSTWRPIARFVHPALLARWEPVRDWLGEPANRRELILRTQISRQSHLWKRTDCNREYLLGEAGYAEAHAFAERRESEMEPGEQELLAHSWAQILLQRRRNRVTLGAILVVLLLFASVALFALWDARNEARISRAQGLLRASDIALEHGDPLQSVRLAWDAGERLPGEATQRLAKAIAGNQLLATVQPAAVPGSQWLAPAFSSDGAEIVTFAADGDGDGGADARARRWQLVDGRFEGGGPLGVPDAPIRSIRIVGDGPSRRVLAIGYRGVWVLPAEGPPGEADQAADRPPDWPCGAAARFDALADPSGRWLVVPHRTPAQEDALCLLDLSRPGRVVWDQALPEYPIRGLAFSPDGSRLAVASRVGRVLLIDTETGSHAGVLPREGTFGRGASRLAFDQDGARIAVATWDEQVRVFDRDGEHLATLGRVERGGRVVRIHQSSARALAFSPDGRNLLVGDGTGQLVRWTLDTGTPEVIGEHELGISDIDIAPGIDPRLGEHLALSLSQDGTVRLWRLESGKVLSILGQDAAISAAAFSRDGRRIMTASQKSGAARLWSVAPVSGLAFRELASDHLRDVALAELPAGGGQRAGLLMATAAYDGSIDVWRYDPAAPEAAPTRYLRLDGHRDRARQVVFSPSVRLLASGGSDGTARVWDLAGARGCRLPVAADPNACATPDAADCPRVYALAFAPDARWLVTASSEKKHPVRLWDPVACEALPQPPAFGTITGSTRALALGADATGQLLLASGGNDGRVRLLRERSTGGWSALCDIETDEQGVGALELSPDGRWLAAAGRDGRTALIGIDAGGCAVPRFLLGRAGRLYDVAFSPDSELLVTGAFDAKAQVWSVDGTLVADLVGQQNRIGSVAFSPDGQWIMTGSRDGTIAIWKRPPRRGAAPPSPYLILDADLGAVTDTVFDSSGRRIAAAYWGGAAVLWRLWSEDARVPYALAERWGSERARLALIGEAARYLKALDGPTPLAPAGEGGSAPGTAR